MNFKIKFLKVLLEEFSRKLILGVIYISLGA